MKASILSPVLGLLVVGITALPASIPTSVHVPVSQDPSPPRPFPKYALDGGNPLEERDPLSRFSTDPENEVADPSPPRPFPADHLVETNDPSPPRPFPKYPLIEGNPLEERIPLALSRFPTDGEDEVNDPSPPRPFPAGRLVEAGNPSPPLQERDPSAPHKVVEVNTAVVDPSLPSPSTYNVEEGENLLEERDPLSRFPTESGTEASDPSPPRPFPAGRLVETNNSVSSDHIEPRSPSPLLRNTEGSEAEANDPSPPRPFPAGHPVEIEPRAGDLPPHRGHGGYFPPLDLSVSEPTAPAGHPVGAEPRVEDLPPSTGLAGNFLSWYLPPVSKPTAPAVHADLENPDATRRPCDPLILDCHGPALPTFSDAVLTLVSLPATSSNATPTWHHPNHRIPIATAFAPHATLRSRLTNTSTTTTSPSCTTTLTSYHALKPPFTLNHTVHAHTTTSTYFLDCSGCALAVTTLDIGNGPQQIHNHSSGASGATATDAGTMTEFVPACTSRVQFITPYIREG